MSQNVLADPQFGVARLLRPFSTFETVYEGKSCKRPIQFTEEGAPADEFAGEPGYDPNLLRGIKVPMGANIKLLLPALFPIPLWNSGPTVVGFYRYLITWRWKNIEEYLRTKEGPYHIGNSINGVSDGGRPRVYKPAAFSASAYAEAEPGAPTFTNLDTAYPVAVVNETIRTIKIGGSAQNEAELPSTATFPYVPLMPSGFDGAYQQGVIGLSGSLSISKYNPSYIMYSTCAEGDEMLIGLYRDVVSTDIQTNDTWHFDTVDVLITSFIDSTSQNGIYLFTGTS